LFSIENEEKSFEKYFETSLEIIYFKNKIIFIRRKLIFFLRRAFWTFYPRHLNNIMEFFAIGKIDKAYVYKK